MNLDMLFKAAAYFEKLANTEDYVKSMLRDRYSNYLPDSNNLINVKLLKGGPPAEREYMVYISGGAGEASAPLAHEMASYLSKRMAPAKFTVKFMAPKMAQAQTLEAAVMQMVKDYEPSLKVASVTDMGQNKFQVTLDMGSVSPEDPQLKLHLEEYLNTRMAPASANVEFASSAL